MCAVAVTLSLNPNSRIAGNARLSAWLPRAVAVGSGALGLFWIGSRLM